jgi:beta-glucanase (GH16 family)
MTHPANSRFVMPLRFLLVALSLSLATARPAHAQATNCASQGVSTSTTGAVNWNPQWCQEFNATTAGPPDTTVWSFDLGNNNGWGNNEVEVYCGPPGTMNNPLQCPTMFSTTTNTVYLDGSGHLVIQPINNSGTWISTRMKTQGTMNFQYGRIEASIQLPDTTNQGLWPAFWSLGSNITSTPWPACGEADIMEDWSPAVFNGPGPNGNRATIHTALTGGSGKGGSYTFPSGQQASTAFHAYGLIWSANMMQYYVDTPMKPFFIVTPSDLAAGDTWPFNANIFLITNVAVGGTLGGSTSSLVNPQAMIFDYVRQYMPSAVPAPSLGNPPSITVKAGATTGNTSTFTPTLMAGTGFVYFSCSANAPKASCAVSTNDPLNTHVVNSSPTGAAETVTVTITTTANASSLPLFFDPKIRFWLPIGVLGILLSTFVVFVMRRGRPTLLPAHALIGFILVIALMVGCGGGAGYTPPPSSGGTTPGNYQVTVSAFTESNTSGNADATAQISLTVN